MLASFEQALKCWLFSSQIQTDATFEKQLHEAMWQLILDASRENQPQKADQRDAQTSPIKTFAEPSTSLEYTSLAERATRFDETTQDESTSVNKDGGEMPGRHDQSTRSALETPAKKNSYEGKKSGTSGMEKYETESIKSYTASGCLEISKRISHKISEWTSVFKREAPKWLKPVPT